MYVINEKYYFGEHKLFFKIMFSFSHYFYKVNKIAIFKLLFTLFITFLYFLIVCRVRITYL